VVDENLLPRCRSQDTLPRVSTQWSPLKSTASSTPCLESCSAGFRHSRDGSFRKCRDRSRRHKLGSSAARRQRRHTEGHITSGHTMPPKSTVTTSQSAWHCIVTGRAANCTSPRLEQTYPGRLPQPPRASSTQGTAAAPMLDPQSFCCIVSMGVLVEALLARAPLSGQPFLGPTCVRPCGAEAAPPRV